MQNEDLKSWGVQTGSLGIPINGSGRGRQRLPNTLPWCFQKDNEVRFLKICLKFQCAFQHKGKILFTATSFL